MSMGRVATHPTSGSRPRSLRARLKGDASLELAPFQIPKYYKHSGLPIFTGSEEKPPSKAQTLVESRSNPCPRRVLGRLAYLPYTNPTLRPQRPLKGL
jgi:hypothetical protein